MKVFKHIAGALLLLVSLHGFGQLQNLQQIESELSQFKLKAGTKSWRINPENGLNTAVDSSPDTPPAAGYTNNYIGFPSGAMTSWNSQQYTQGYLEQFDLYFKMNYRLLYPMGYNQNEPYKYPLIVMMHGAGESGYCWTSCYDPNSNPRFRNNDHNLLHGGLPHLNAVNLANGKKAEDPTLDPKAFPGFVIFPQHDATVGWAGANFENVARIILLLRNSLNIDPNRIYIHGLSNGGMAAWRMIDLFPELFAASLPMSATVATNFPLTWGAPANLGPASYSNFAHVPVWQFQGSIDQAPSVADTKIIRDIFKSQGGSIRYTEYAGLGHGIWNNAYAETDFFSWMLSQNKANIHVYYGETTLCATNSNGIKLGVSQGFMAYQWEQDGVIMPGATTQSIIATQPGTYRARFSRVSATPSEAQWNIWSKPVVIKQGVPVTALLTTNGNNTTTTGSPHLPGVNGETAVTLKGTNVSEFTKNWIKDGTLLTGGIPPISTLDSITRSDAGVFTLKTIPVNGCETLPSTPIYVTVNSPINVNIPTNLQGQITSPGSVHLFWEDNSPNETGFEIYRATNPAGPWKLRAQLGEDIIAYQDFGLLPDATYYYKMRAVSPTGKSNYTANLQIDPLDDTVPPTPPQNLVGVTNINLQVKLTWAASTDNTGVSEYIIDYGSGSVNTGSTNTTYTVTGLTPNTNYFFTVKAKDFAGNLSQPSNQINRATVFTGLEYEHSTGAWNWLTEVNWGIEEFKGTLTNFTIAKPPRTQDDFFNFRFNGYLYITTGGNYQFRTKSDDGSMLFLGSWFNCESVCSTPDADPSDGPTPGPAFTTATRIVNHDGLHASTYSSPSANQNLASGSSYPISVIFFERGGGEELIVEYMGPDTPGGNTWVAIPSSALKSGNAPGLGSVPNQVTGLTSTIAGMTGINLNWTALSGSPNYEVHRALVNTASAYSIVARVSTNSFNDTGLQPNTIYYYKVRGVNSNGTGNFSSVTSKQTNPDTQAPTFTLPANIVALTTTYTNVGLSWTAATDNVGVTSYKIFANGVLLGTSTSTTYLATSLIPSTLYNITVSARDFAGNESAQSAALPVTTDAPLAFYSKPAGDLNLTSTWGTETDGTGTEPNFSYNGQYYHLTRPATLATAWTLGGSVTRVVVENNASLALDQALSGTVSVANNATVQVNAGQGPGLDALSPTSTVVFNNSTTIPMVKYGNLVVNGVVNSNGLKTIAAGILEVTGDLTLGSGVGLNGAANNATTIKLSGNLITGTSTDIAPTDNRVAMHFTGSGSHTYQVGSDQHLFQIKTDANGSVTVNNVNPVTITLGSVNGGGLELANGSTLNVDDNNLQFIWASRVNPTTTGKLSINRGDISLTTSSSTAANFYFDASNNKVEDFRLESTGGGTTFIQHDMEVYDGLKIKAGVLNSSGHVKIKSSATASASIEQIEGNGSIAGNVTVERFMSVGRKYRYISSPVAGLTVANWQTYFPITGSFTGASTGAGLSASPSLFYYNEPTPGGWVAYPTTNNLAPIVTGRGYSAFIRDSVNPVTIIGTGLPHQGSIPFTLTGDTGSSTDGWNLLGNPYASDIVWNNTGWTSNGVGNVISVRENYNGGGFGWKTWDRINNTGTLENGKIPAGQAFWVQTTIAGPSLTVHESAKTTESAAQNSEFYRLGAPEVSPNVFSMWLTDGTYTDAAFVNFRVDGLDAYDKLYDGVKRANSYFNLSTKSTDGITLVVNSMANQFCDKAIDVVLENVQPGNYTLKFDNIETFVNGQVTLEDKLLNENFVVANDDFELNVELTAEVDSYTNRFVLHVTRPELMVSNTVTAESATVCPTQNNATIAIENSQVGVIYQAINSDTNAISTQAAGNGGKLLIEIPVGSLSVGSNKIFVRASFDGCSAQILTDGASINVQNPTISASAEILKSCLGSVIEISVESTGTSTRWYDLANDTTYTVTGNKIVTQPLQDYNSFYVYSISASGCVSEEKAVIQVLGVTTDKPMIEVKDGALTTESNNPVQWLLDNQVIPGATGSSYVPSTTGVYSVISKNGSCISESDAFTFVVTGMEEKSDVLLATLYPNPVTKESFTVQGNSGTQGEISIELVDMLGRLVHNEVINSEEFNRGYSLNKPASGVYLVRIKQGKHLLSMKLLVN